MSLTNSKNSQSHNDRYLRFSLGQEEYAVPLLTVREVIAMPEVTPIPQTPPYFLGIMNLRGQVITIIDLRAKLSIKPLNGPEVSVIICNLGSVSLGVVVDSINSVIAPSESELAERPDLSNHKASEYISSVYQGDKGLVLIIELSRLFSFEEQAMAAKKLTTTRTA